MLCAEGRCPWVLEGKSLQGPQGVAQGPQAVIPTEPECHQYTGALLAGAKAGARGGENRM